MSLLNRHVIERVMRYYHCITERFSQDDNEMVSSARLAGFLGVDDTQVRKDLAAIGVKGRSWRGFTKNDILEAIQQTLGFKIIHNGVIIGSGRLGGAIAGYEGFQKYGLHIAALFDTDPRKIGLMVANHIIQPLEQLETIIKERQISVAILTVPAKSAQAMSDRLVPTGIRSIWNFSHVSLDVPDHIYVRNEHLSIGWAHLSYFLKEQA